LRRPCRASAGASNATEEALRILERADWPDVVFAFHDGDEIGPRMLARIARHTGLRPVDL
jgi:hypothetical protein